MPKVVRLKKKGGKNAKKREGNNKTLHTGEDTPDPRSKWEDRMYVQVYEMAKDGMSDRAIAKALGISGSLIIEWKKKKPLLRLFLEEARKTKEISNASETYQDFVYKRLPENLKPLWNEIQACSQAPGGIRKMEAMLRQSGKRARQHLFIYALPACNFNMTEACRKVNISRDTMNSWILREPKFAQMIQFLHEAKKDFFEGALIKLIKQGNANATIFANKTMNRDRGYGEKIQHEVSGTVEHKHTLVNIEDLHLPLEFRKQLLDYVRRAEQRKIEGPTEDKDNRVVRYTLPEFAGKDKDYDVIDAEYETVEEDEEQDDNESDGNEPEELEGEEAA